MVLVGLGSLLAVLGVAVSPPAESVEPVAVDDRGSDRARLHTPELSFSRPSTLYILGKGRFGTWSLVGSNLGISSGCDDALSIRCTDLVTAQLGIAWRPFGSLVSLFSAVGVAVVPGIQAPPGFQMVSGVRVDLPSRARWRLGLGRAR